MCVIPVKDLVVVLRNQQVEEKKCSSDVLLGPVNSEKLYVISKLFELFSFL